MTPFSDVDVALWKAGVPLKALRHARSATLTRDEASLEKALGSRQSIVIVEHILDADEQGQPSGEEEGRAQRLRQYIENAASDRLTAQMATRSWHLWKMLYATMGQRLRVPSACPGNDNDLMLTWRVGEHYLELEILPDGPAEFFYKNRRTGELWNYDYDLDTPLSQDVKDKLALFINL